MEHYDLNRLTLTIYRSLLEEPEFKDYPYTGIALQTYLQDSEHQIKDLVKWGRKRNQRFCIHLVKGGLLERGNCVGAAKKLAYPGVYQKT